MFSSLQMCTFVSDCNWEVKKKKQQKKNIQLVFFLLKRNSKRMISLWRTVLLEENKKELSLPNMNVLKHTHNWVRSQRWGRSMIAIAASSVNSDICWNIYRAHQTGCHALKWYFHHMLWFPFLMCLEVKMFSRMCSTTDRKHQECADWWFQMAQFIATGVCGGGTSSMNMKILSMHYLFLNRIWQLLSVANEGRIFQRLPITSST